MKKLILLPLLCLTLATPALAQETQQDVIPTIEQPDRFKDPDFWKMVKKVRAEVKKDNEFIFEQFAFMGFSNCLDKTYIYNGALATVYTDSYNNHVDLMPRMISLDHLKQELNQFHKKNFPYDLYGLFKGVNTCQAVYNVKNKKLRQIYNKIVNGSKYLRDWEFTY